MTEWRQRNLINWVAELFANPCAPEPVLIIELALEAYLTAFYSFEIPDIKEDIKIATGKSWLKHGKAALKNSEEAAPPILKKAGKAIVGFAEPIDRLMWISWIVGVLSGTASAFATAALNIQPCVEPGGLLWAKSNLPIAGFDEWTDWQIGPGWFAASGNQGLSFGSLINVENDQSAMIYGGFRPEVFLGLGNVESYSIRIIDINGTVYDQSDWQRGTDADDDIAWVHHIHHANGHGTAFELQFQATTSGEVIELQAGPGNCGFEIWTPGESKPEPMHILAPNRVVIPKWLKQAAKDAL